MLKLENVTKKFGDFTAVDNLNFEVKEGEVFGLLGLNGAGKTTTFRMILNIFEASKGNITYFDKQLSYDDSDEIGFLPEERSLLPKYKVHKQLKFFGKLKSMTDEDIETQTRYWLKRFNCEEYYDVSIKELSKGNKQKIQFISSVINSPKLLILDEPFSGLDPINVELFKDAINYFSKKGTIIIFSSHRMDHVELFCERLAILAKGKTILQGKIKEIKESFGQKNILIKSSLGLDSFKECPGIVNTKQVGEEILVTISDDKYVKDVFNIVKQSDIVTKFEVELPTLNEIFVEKVGKSYEE